RKRGNGPNRSARHGRRRGGERDQGAGRDGRVEAQTQQGRRRRRRPRGSTMPEASSDRVIVFDTTLRDGEQAPGASMDLEQKLRVARALTALGVDVLEAGFPAASPGDYEAVAALARYIEGPTLCALARAHRARLPLRGSGSVIEAGATTVNIPDTVGYAIPSQFAGLIMHLRRRVRGIERIVLSVHCHDDLGLAVANTLAAVEAGARQVECTVNGIGERAGNCSLEEVVMALRTRADHFHLRTGIRTQELCAASRAV